MKKRKIELFNIRTCGEQKQKNDGLKQQLQESLTKNNYISKKSFADFINDYNDDYNKYIEQEQLIKKGTDNIASLENIKVCLSVIIKMAICNINAIKNHCLLTDSQKKVLEKKYNNLIGIISGSLNILKQHIKDANEEQK